MLALLSDVKARLGLPDSDVQDDALLTNYIALVSARFDNDCNRKFAYGAQVDDFEGDETELRLSRFPIDEALPVAFTTLDKQANGWQVQTPDYVVRRGCVLSLLTETARWKGALRVAYTGGYVLPDMNPAPATTNPALPDEVELTAIEQVVYWYQNKNRLGLTHVSGKDGNIAQFAGLDLLPSVQAIIRKYERWML